MKRALSIQSEIAENVSRKRPAIIASSQSFEEENEPEEKQVNRFDVDMNTNIDDHSMSHASQTSGETDGLNQMNPLDVSEESMRSAQELEEMSFDAPSSLSRMRNNETAEQRRRRLDRENERRRQQRAQNPQYRQQHPTNIPREFHGDRKFWTEEMRQSYTWYMREFRRQWLARMTEDEQRPTDADKLIVRESEGLELHLSKGQKEIGRLERGEPRGDSAVNCTDKV